MDRTLDSAPPDPQALRYALWILLVVGFLTGGSSQISGSDDTAVQLLGLGVLAYALWILAIQPAVPLRNVALALAAITLLVPVLQLMPIPVSLWEGIEPRVQLAADLSAVGVAAAPSWSLDPDATRRAALFLLAPLAAFCATLALPSRAHGGLLRIILGLAIFSLLLAFAQLGVPAESPLNPFPLWAARFNGVFANNNHQAISLVLAIVIALAGALASAARIGEGRLQAWTPWILGFLALFAFAALPLTASRGALLIGVFGIAVVPLAMGVFNGRRLRESNWVRTGVVASLVLVAIGLWGTFRWMQVGEVDELRAPLRAATLELGWAHAPLGTGVGAFVPAFEQGGPDALLLWRYVNHAHNDFLQIWMEAGWLGVIVLALVVGFLCLAAARAIAGSRDDRLPAVAASLGLAALLLHSWVDYPLRTGSLALVAGVLAGILVARASRPAARTRAAVVGDIDGARHTA